ncbi:beta-ketoacyl-[acyl-carrier-protein] synthase family protein [Amycolatopsis aidingensis]|uniref:beta-ketoacyl-[acyl-carrier-protein] synthase family protein n=1 Tax=Amycolatopsis aidingensis TaxID=2842453 RepID=UPI001C0B63F7|nr:beta-ketoacyl-[acyl-carrier-protein] synthase family protein [Amycolatopsis aidingensis]
MRASDTVENRRVVVTGLGAVTSVGVGAGNFLAALRTGRHGGKPIRAFDTSGFAHANGCEVTDFDPEPWIRSFPVNELGRATQFSVAAAAMAVADSDVCPHRLRELTGLVAVGTTDGESRDLDQLVQAQVYGTEDQVDQVVARRVPAPRLSTCVARELGLVDVEAVTIPTACAAGNYAIGYGADVVRAGEAEFALVGGADAVCRKTFAGFYRVGTIAPERCQPFDANRKGLLTGEGAGMMLLESLDSALTRGARVYAEILGYGLNCDADHPVAPNLDSLARCMRLAHANAGVKPGDIDFISAHGTGTKANDITEASAIRRVFGERPPPTISIKSMIGHTMGAASALAAIGCALAITHQFIPPTINHERTDLECGLDCVPNVAREARLRVVQNNALAFGGNNAVVIMGEYSGGRSVEDLATCEAMRPTFGGNDRG